MNIILFSVQLCKTNFSCLQFILPNRSHLSQIPKFRNCCSSKVKEVTFSGQIPRNKLNITYSRSSAPGGQNVDKRNTKVEIRFHLASADWINDFTKQRLLHEKKVTVTKDGFIVLKNEETRYAHLNLTKALKQLSNLITEASSVKCFELSPETKQKIDERKERANAKRLEMKRHRSMIRKDRYIRDL